MMSILSIPILFPIFINDLPQPLDTLVDCEDPLVTKFVTTMISIWPMYYNRAEAVYTYNIKYYDIFAKCVQSFYNFGKLLLGFSTTCVVFGRYSVFRCLKSGLWYIKWFSVFRTARGQLSKFAGQGSPRMQ